VTCHARGDEVARADARGRDDESRAEQMPPRNRGRRSGGVAHGRGQSAPPGTARRARGPAKHIATREGSPPGATRRAPPLRARSVGRPGLERWADLQPTASSPRPLRGIAAATAMVQSSTVNCTRATGGVSGAWREVASGREASPRPPRAMSAGRKVSRGRLPAAAGSLPRSLPVSVLRIVYNLLLADLSAVASAKAAASAPDSRAGERFWRRFRR